MDTLTDHSSYIELLALSDRQLLEVDAKSLKTQIYQASTFQDEGMWTDELMEYISKMTLSDLPLLEWVTEKHYAAKLRDSSMQRYFEHFHLIGYIRVTFLRLLHTSNMGYTNDDLHFVLAALKKHYNNALESTRILDIGCGTGELLTELCIRGYSQVEGTDISPRAIHLTKDRLNGHKVRRVECMSFEDYARSSSAMAYDVIMHSDVIEHIAPFPLSLFLEEVRRLLKPHGLMIVMTPSKLTGPHDSTRRFEPSSTEPLGFHLREFFLSELEEILLDSGFEHLETVASLPSLNEHGASLSEENFRTKLQLEKCLMSTDRELRKPLVDGMYFKGLVCQKLP
ncbi:MAG TPA: class I SAM-dependent methyltransferase [Ktedonobacteraceae bacterium]|nr:class I SAM-dependent methyltransferase [Ktedonobacteraceae bacterium]